jgi:hypothetical protein
LENIKEENPILLFLYDSRIKENQLKNFLSKHKKILDMKYLSFLVGNVFSSQKQITSEILEKNAKNFNINNFYEINIFNLSSIEVLFNLIIVEILNSFQNIIEYPLELNLEKEIDIDEDKEINLKINNFGNCEILSERDEILRQLNNKIKSVENLNLTLIVRKLKEELLRKESMKELLKERSNNINENKKKIDEQIRVFQMEYNQLNEKLNNICKQDIPKKDIIKLKNEIEIKKQKCLKIQNTFNEINNEIIFKQRDLEQNKLEYEKLINERNEIRKNIKKTLNFQNELNRRIQALESNKNKE